MFGAPETVPSAVLREAVEAEYLLEADESGSTAGPADTYRVAGSRTKVGFISAMSNPFVRTAIDCASLPMARFARACSQAAISTSWPRSAPARATIT